MSYKNFMYDSVLLESILMQASFFVATVDDNVPTHCIMLLQESFVKKCFVNSFIVR
jgi:hypothetical protein